MTKTRQQEIPLSNLTDQEALILKEVNINEINPIKGTLFGAWISAGDLHGIPAELCKVQRDEGCIRVQLIVYSDRYCKGVELLLVQKDNDIFGKIEWAKATRRRSDRNDRIENILQSDWNDISNPNIANLQEVNPVGKDGYGIENIVVEIAEHEPIAEKTPEASIPTESIDSLRIVSKRAEMIVADVEKDNNSARKEKKLRVISEEQKAPYTINPIKPEPVTLERPIKELGISFSKTYDQLASAPIQGVDTAGRRTIEISVKKLPDLKSANKIELNKNMTLNSAMNIIAAIPTTDGLLYENVFWSYLKTHVNTYNVIMKKGDVLGSSFGILRTKLDNGNGNPGTTNLPLTEDVVEYVFETKYSTSINYISDELLLRKDENDKVIFEEKEYSGSIVNFDDSWGRGIVIPTPVQFNNKCPECSGKGKIRCPECGGSGREQYVDGYYANGEERIKTGQCHHCYGKGYFECERCASTGKIDKGTGKIAYTLHDGDILCSLVQTNCAASPFFSLRKSDYSYNEVTSTDLQKYDSYKDCVQGRKTGKWVVNLMHDLRKINMKYLYQPDHLEVLFNTENENSLAVDNHHRQVASIENVLGKQEFEYLYYQNLQQAGNAFNLKDPNERIVAIFEKHDIVDTHYKLDITFDSGTVFTFYVSEVNKCLYYFGSLPQLSEVVELQMEKEKLAEEKKLEEARLKEEQRQTKYSQSMDMLLDDNRTTKIGFMSKLFKTKDFQKSKDAEKAIKLMFYVAKADGTLDVDEKELLTKMIISRFDKGYTEESRQAFLDLLNISSLPELTKEDCTFSSKYAAEKAMKSLVEVAKINGDIADEERELLEKIAKNANMDRLLKKLI